MRWIWIALLLFSGCAAAHPPAGRYRLIGGPDVASQLVLGEDGHFAYVLSAGALDEEARGRWAAEGKVVRLTSDPKPVPPRFRASEPALDPGAPLHVHVTWPDGRGIAGVDVRVGFEAGDAIEGYTQEGGWTLEDLPERIPRWLELEVPMHALRSPRFPIDTVRANRLTFVLEPNDLGLRDFTDMLLSVEGDRLIMDRGGASLTYVRE